MEELIRFFVSMIYGIVAYLIIDNIFKQFPFWMEAIFIVTSAVVLGKFFDLIF